MKIVHISDLHFGMHREEIIEPFLDELQLIQPDVVLISGDVTQRAVKEQYFLFNQFVERLPGIVLIVPGNHDVPLYPSQFFIRMYSPFKYYNRYVNTNLEAQFTNDKVRILGVNSVNPYRVKKGRLSTETMNKIKNYFAPPFSGLNILFFHHNFDRLEGAHKPLTNYQELIEYLKTSSINIVCAGHSHYANVNIIAKNNSEHCVFLHAGSLLCARTKDGANSYYLIDYADSSCTITLHRYENKSFSTTKKYHESTRDT